MSARRTPAFAIRGLICGLILLLHGSAGWAQVILDQETVQAVFQAIEDNDTNALKALYARNPHCLDDAYYATYHSARYPLLQAAADGRTAIVALMLKYGADPDVAGDTRNSADVRQTPLEAAVQYGHLETCELLLKAGANPDHQSIPPGTALHWAFSGLASLRTNVSAMAGLLLDYGANPYLEARFDKLTPIELHVTRGDGKLVARMLGQDKANPLGAKAIEKISTSKRRRQTLKTTDEFLAEHGVTLLCAASQRGELEAVQALLKAGVPARTNAAGNLTLLQAFSLSAATARGNSFDSNRWFQIRHLLIQNGADYDAFAATAWGDINQARHVLSADQSVLEARDRDGQTLLHWAVQADRLALTSFWIESGVLLAATNLAGQTALHLAAAQGLAEHLKILLAARAPTDIRDTNGWTPLDAAIQAKQAGTIHWLLADKTAAPHPERGLTTALHEAAANGNLAALAALTETKTNLEARNELGLTPLQLAVTHGHLAAAALLVDQGADVNARDPDGNTLLFQIIPRALDFDVRDRPPTTWWNRMGNDPRKETYLKYLTSRPYAQWPDAVLQTIGFLLACGIDVKATNRAGQTAIGLAADKETQLLGERGAFLKLLAAGGGNINETDDEGNTALHLAGREFTADRVAILLAAGADINATNHRGRTPLHKFAENIGGWDETESGTNEPFQFLVRSKPNVNARDDEGLTPLHVLAMAATSFKKEATRLLLDAGGNPNLRDNHGRTPAHIFLSGFWPWSDVAECMDMLVKAGADLSAKDDRGWTPLHYLAARGDNQPMSFMKGIGETLAAAKVDVEARDKDGNTPLHVAGKTRTMDVYDWLVQHGASLDATNNAGQTPRQLTRRSTRPLR